MPLHSAAIYGDPEIVNVLLDSVMTGNRGVGKSTLVREVARRAATCAISFLQDYPFLWVDCRDVPREESRDDLEAIFNVVTEATWQMRLMCNKGRMGRDRNGTVPEHRSS